MIILTTLVCCYVAFGLFIYIFQRLLIFPGAATQGTPDAVVTPGVGSELVHLASPDGTPIVALFGGALSPEGEPLPDDPHRLTILYFYGNGMSMNDCWDNFIHWRKLGFNMLMPDYLGYGMSGGKPSEVGCRQTADAAYDWLQTRPGDKRIVATGWSLGSGVATDLAFRRPVAGLAIFSPFTSMATMGQRQFPLLPVFLVISDRFDSLSKIPNVTCPIFIAHGTDDGLIPFAMAQRLRDAAKTPVDFMPVDGAGHNDIFSHGGDELLARFKAFLDKLP
jgi:pimeloyl-ACP methyl ester carboxylesterase